MLRCCTRTLYLGIASTLGSSKGGACACAEVQCGQVLPGSKRVTQ